MGDGTTEIYEGSGASCERNDELSGRHDILALPVEMVSVAAYPELVIEVE